MLQEPQEDNTEIKIRLICIARVVVYFPVPVILLDQPGQCYRIYPFV
jgi:hypothetical protein